MNAKIGNLLESYAEMVQRHPVKLLTVALLVTVVLSSGASMVETKQQNQEDLLPDSIPTMKAYETISAEFSSGSGTTYNVLVEAEPQYANSTEIRDLRSPEALRYMESASEDLRAVDKISSVSGPGDLFSDLPSGKSETRQILETLGEQRWRQYFSSDFSTAKINIQSVDLTAQEQMEIADTIRNTFRVHDKPAGVSLSYTGQPFIDQAFQNQTQETMSVTGIAALLGVILVVVILFRSLFYGGTSLLTLVFGVATGFGIFGWLGLNMSPATSGAITMGIGVAIDFGIQPIARYIEERKHFQIEKSLEETIKGVATPMTVGLIAANIGFLSLNVGRVTFLSDLGTLLTLTTTMAYVSAFTVIPSSLVIYDRYFTANGTSGFTLSKLTSNNTQGDNQQ